MYNAIFRGDNGKEFHFGIESKAAFDIDAGSGVNVDIKTSQGFSQIGETVEGQSVAGRSIAINGVLFGDIPAQKKALSAAFAPFVGGVLTFEDSYYIRVHVKTSPAFSPVRNDGKFSLQLFAPIPFFYAVEEQQFPLSFMEPVFSFPVNYSDPHKFGNKVEKTFINVYNDGDASSPLNVKIQTSDASSNITILNLRTYQTMKINTSIAEGDTINVWRDIDGVFRATLTSDGQTSDIVPLIDETSDLFDIRQGENLLKVDAETGGEYLNAVFVLNKAVVNVFET